MNQLGRRGKILALIGGTACVVSIVAAMVVLWLVTSNLKGQLSSNEAATCHIQARALPANKALAETLLDINRLIGFSHARTAKAANVSPAEFALFLNLRAESGKYAAIEAKQPGSRKC